jgi:hypothetical protein
MMPMIQRKNAIPSCNATRCRQRLSHLLKRLSGLMPIFKAHAPLVKGTLYDRKRRCGRAGCRCERGELHVSPALCLSEEGKTRMVALGGVDLSKLRHAVEGYREFRRARAAVVKICEEVLGLIDRLERLRRIEPETLREPRSPAPRPSGGDPR